MNVATYMSQLAQQVGGVYVPKCPTFKEVCPTAAKGAVFGARKGYLMALALTQAGRTSGFIMLVRYPRAPIAPPLQEALKDRPGFSSFFGKKSVKVAVDGVLVSWTYSFTKPKPEEIAALLDAVTEEISKVVQPFTGKCEDCGAAEAREITLMNGIPGYHCLACQMRVAAEKQREADEYKAKDANYVVGLAVGLVAAAAAGSAWGWFAGLVEADSGKWYPQLHAVMAFAVSIPICLLMFKAIGKRDRVGQVLAIVFTLAAKWWGEAIYFTYLVMHIKSIAFSWPLVGTVLRHFWDYQFSTGGHVFVTICDVVISLAVPWMPWAKLPKFVPVFENINPDGSLSQTLAQGPATR
jgi:hypothetical protein